MDRKPDLARDGLDQRDLGFSPAPLGRAVSGEDADHLVEDEDRRRQDRPRAQGEERLSAAQARVVELGCGHHIRDRDRVTRAEGEVRRGQPLRDVGSRGALVVPPFGGDRHRPAGLTEPDEAARNCERAPGLADGDFQHLLEIQLGAHFSADFSDQPFTGERSGESVCRASSAKRGGRFVREPLEDLELGRCEQPRLADCCSDEHPGHASIGQERNEGRALRVENLAPGVGLCARAQVVHAMGLAVAGGHANSAGILLQVERKPAPPRLVHPTGGEPVRPAHLLVDEHQKGHLDGEQRFELVEEMLDDLCRRDRAGERCREAPERGLPRSFLGARGGVASSPPRTPEQPRPGR